MSGPWETEGDEHAWMTDAGYLGLIIRSPVSLCLCGYVAVPANHPWAGVQLGDIDVPVHGGITFAGPPDEVRTADGGDWWFVGFDCSHRGDFMPVLAERSIGVVYRDLAYVRGEVEFLARVAAAIADAQP